MNITRQLALIGVFKNFWLLYTARLFKREQYLLALRSGPVFKVQNLNNNVGTILEVWKLREYGELDHLQGIQTPVVVDVGANIGTFTIYAKHTLPAARVIAIEPEVGNFSLLHDNVSLNGFSESVTCINSALCASEGEIDLFVVDSSSGKNSTKHQFPGAQTVTVSCTTLDVVFAQHNITRCDLLKIDCEGAEYDILFNASPEVLNCVGSIILEWHGVDNYSDRDLVVFLERNDFRVERDDRFPSMLYAYKDYVTCI